MPQSESMALPPRLPLVVTTSNRAGSTDKDARLVNCYLEVNQEGELFIYKRPGLASASVVADGQTGRGTYHWQGDVYSIFGGALYRNGVSVGTGLDTTNGVYRFDSIRGATPKLILGNGKKTYAYDVAGGLTADLHTIDSAFPTETTKGFAYLNGPLYVMQANTPNIWNSANNSVSVAGNWNPVNFIAAQIEPDNGVFLTKQLVYVVALKQWTVEFFFDAGNAQGSPLGSVQGMKANYGCASADSVQKIDDVLFWLTINQEATLQVAMMDKGAVEIISTASIERLLENADFSIVYSWKLKISGHSFYVLTIKNANLTIVYDITQQKWHQWTDQNGNYLPIVASTYDSSNRHIVQHESNGRLFYMNTTYFKDLNDPIIVDIYTPNFDAGTKRKKHLGMLKIIADQVSGSSLRIRYNDNDYDSKSWSQWREVDLRQKDPYIQNCGTFRKRAYNFRHDKDTFFRIQAVEVQFDLGTL